MSAFLAILAALIATLAAIIVIVCLVLLFFDQAPFLIIARKLGWCDLVWVETINGCLLLRRKKKSPFGYYYASLHLRDTTTILRDDGSCDGNYGVRWMDYKKASNSTSGQRRWWLFFLSENDDDPIFALTVPEGEKHIEYWRKIGITGRIIHCEVVEVNKAE